MIYFRGKKTLGWRALQAARRTVPRIADQRDYDRAIDYFKLGFARGFATARRLAKQPRNRRTSQE